jgi:hypothetical protein
MNYLLPEGYKSRLSNPLYHDEPSTLIYQPYVYRLALHISKSAELKYIIDLGSGSGRKLLPFRERHSIIAIDSQYGIDLIKKIIPEAHTVVHDLEDGLPEIAREILYNSIIILSDVVEHIKRPEILMRQLAFLSRIVPYILISTPDRDRARGWLDNGPPANPTHVREWSSSEFVRFMMAMGFENIPFHGHTINTSTHRAKTTLLTVSGSHASINLDGLKKIKVAAIMHGYNEHDFIAEVVHHLHSQGIEIHYFDNWSDDGTWELAKSFAKNGLIAHCQRYPEAPTKNYEWRKQLEKTSEYAAQIDADWVMHYDVDELRYSPWPNVGLKDSISYVDSLGYNAIDFTVIEFRFTQETELLKENFEENLTHFEFGRRAGHFSQVKCWKNTKTVDLSGSGGHNALFDERRIFPIKFLLKHYPLRNKMQSRDKVFRYRLPRFAKEKTLYGWHGHYDKFQNMDDVPCWKYEELIPWHPIYFNTEFIVERISGIGLVLGNTMDQN